MSKYCALKSLLWVAAFWVASAGSSASASVHVTYNILQSFEVDGFSASWLHAATDTLNGTPENGALLSGARSSRISGNLEGDLSGNVLSNASGSVSGKLKQLAGYLNGALGITSLTTWTSFEMKLGGAATGGKGALAFETNGAGTGEFTGGYLDFSLWVAGGTASLLDGTFFVKPQAESGSDVLSPNRGTSSEFTLWGWNWMHDGAPFALPGEERDEEPNWGDFLGGLGYTGDPVNRTALTAPLGVALYVVDPDPPAPEALHNPEPGTLMIWGLLTLVAIAVRSSTGRKR